MNQLLLNAIRVSGAVLPYSVDFTTLSDGALPPRFTGATWSISSGKAINTPSLGAELLTDPGLEANYTAGKCDTLTKGGSPTLAESADVHGGSKAQQFTAAAFNDRLNWPTVAGIAGAWYLYSVWSKRTAGTSRTGSNFFQTGALPAAAAGNDITTASYTQQKLSFISTTTNLMFCYPTQEAGSSGFSTVIADDGSLKRLTYADVFALINAQASDIVVKVKPSTIADGSISGVIARASSVSDRKSVV